MSTKTSSEEMAEPTKMVKLPQTEYDRLVKYGYAGESVGTALKRVLDIAEKAQKTTGKEKRS